MNQQNGTKILLAFLAGAAVGAAIGYFLTSDKKDEVFNDLKEGAEHLKKEFDENLSTAKEMVNNFTQGTSATPGSTENPA